MNQSEQLSLPRGPTPTDDALYKRALAIRQKSLGPDHPSVATSLQNLGRFYQLQGRYADAELLYKRSLAIREKALDLNNPDVALGLNALASLHEDQGRYAEALPLVRRATERGHPAFPSLTSSPSAGNRARLATIKR